MPEAAYAAPKRILRVRRVRQFKMIVLCKTFQSTFLRGTAHGEVAETLDAPQKHSRGVLPSLDASKNGEIRLTVDGEWHRGEALGDGLALVDLTLVQNSGVMLGWVVGRRRVRARTASTMANNKGLRGVIRDAELSQRLLLGRSIGKANAPPPSRFGGQFKRRPTSILRSRLQSDDGPPRRDRTVYVRLLGLNLRNYDDGPATWQVRF